MIFFLGFRNDVYNLLNVIDIFIFPSFHEGLGISIIEAQTNGIITYCSNSIPQEARISPFIRLFDLKDKDENIVTRICNEKINTQKRDNAYKYTIQKGYDIKQVCKELELIYSKL